MQSKIIWDIVLHTFALQVTELVRQVIRYKALEVILKSEGENLVSYLVNGKTCKQRSAVICVLISYWYSCE